MVTMGLMRLPGGASGKESACKCRGHKKQGSLGWDSPLEWEMATHSSILDWNTVDRGSWGGYSPWGCQELDMTILPWWLRR